MNLEIMQDGHFGTWLDGRKPDKVRRFCNDTRILSPGDCFVALITEKSDGNDFIKNAERAGASCALVSRPDTTSKLPQFICKNTKDTLREIAMVARSKFFGRTIAITGSYGKTTTKELLSLLLGIKNNTNYQNFNGQLGVPLTVATIDNAEPFAVIEVGVDTPGEIDNLIELVRPDLAIVTGITTIHILHMGSEEKIAQEKSKLVMNALQRGGIGILAEECLKFSPFVSIKSQCIIARKSAKDFGYELEILPNHYSVVIYFKHKKFYFELPKSMSLGTIQDFILACTCALQCGITPDKIQEKIATWQPTHLRGEIIHKGHRTYFADCYNANFVALLDSLRHFDYLFPNNHRLFVIGTLKSEEIGPTAMTQNLSILKSIPLRDGDRVFLVGEDSQMYAQKSGISNISAFDSYNEALTDVEKFSGTVYIKGHRSYTLERLIV